MDQPINDTDYIKNAIQGKWTKGPCPTEWPTESYTEEYTEEYK